MRFFIVLVLSFIVHGCSRPNKEIKIDVVNNYKFILNGDQYSFDVFDEVFAFEDKMIYGSNSIKYDVILRVHKGVNMSTLQLLKLEFSKAKDHIDEIKYSNEK